MTETQVWQVVRFVRSCCRHLVAVNAAWGRVDRDRISNMLWRIVAWCRDKSHITERVFKNTEFSEYILDPFPYLIPKYLQHVNERRTHPSVIYTGHWPAVQSPTRMSALLCWSPDFLLFHHYDVDIYLQFSLGENSHMVECLRETDQAFCFLLPSKRITHLHFLRVSDCDLIRVVIGVVLVKSAMIWKPCENKLKECDF